MRESKNTVSVRGQKRVLVVFAFLIILTLLLLFRTAWIQIVNGDDYIEKAVAQQTSDEQIDAKRGMIMDRNGEVFASSTVCYDVWVRPTDMREKYDEAQRLELIMALSDLLSMEQDDVRKYFDSDSYLLKIGRQVSKETADEIRKLSIYGAEIQETTKRSYPLGTSASNLLGSINDDGVGRSGIELMYNEYLSGVAGRKVFDKDINGNLLAFGERVTYDASNGLNVVLTIDEVLQHYLDEAMKYGYETYLPDKVAGILMDPKTGEILAMSVYPNFDPNNPLEPVGQEAKEAFGEMEEEAQLEYLNKMWRNPLISDVYEPGSTMKLITSSATLEEGLANPETEYYCGGSITVGEYTIVDALHVVHGTQSLTQAVGNSCNPIHAQLAMNLGLTTLYKYYDLYGLTHRTGIDLPGEAYPLIQDRETAGIVGLATMGFGNGIAVTPIQLITALSAIGNDGVVMRPHVVKRLTDSDGKTVVENVPEEVSKVISENTAQEMRSIMESQVETYGGSNAKIPGYRIGGKTGTANVASTDGYSEIVNTSFVSMVPIDDPSAVLLVLCYGLNEGNFGSGTAIPIAKEFWTRALPYMGIEPSVDEESEGWMAGHGYVPDVTGMSYQSAIAVLENYGFKYEVNPAMPQTEDEEEPDFTIIDQYPKAGKKISLEDTIYLYWE